MPSLVCFSLGLLTTLIDIVLVLAPWATKSGVGPAAQEHLLTVLAQAQGLVTVYQHEAEHHLDAQQQRMEIPIDGGLIQQLDVVAGGDPTKCGHGLAVNPFHNKMSLNHTHAYGIIKTEVL